MLATRATVAPLLGAVLALPAPDLAADSLVSPEACDQAGLSAYWQVRVPLLPGERVEGVYPRDRQVYLTTNMGVLVAVAADTGLVRWQVSLAEHGSTIHAPFNVGSDPQTGYVLVTTVSNLFLLEQLDGGVLLKLPLRLPPSGPAVTDGSRVFVGGNNGWLHAIPLHDGFLKWRAEGNLIDRTIWLNALGPSGLIGVERPAPMGIWGGDWSLRLGSPVPSPVALSDGRLYFATEAGRVFCVTSADKREIWSRQLRGGISGTVAVDAGGTYVAGTDHSLYCFAPGDGSLIWRYRMDGPCETGPVLTDDTLYQLSTGAGLYAVELPSGSLRWRLEEGRQLLARDGAVAYILAGEDLAVVDNAIGRIRHRLAVGSADLAAVNTEDPAVYLCNSNGTLICLQPKLVPYLRQEQVRREMRRPSEAFQAVDAEVRDIVESSERPPAERHPLESTSPAPRPPGEPPPAP